MLAAIDAGSNTLRLLVGNVEQGKVTPYAYLRRICRLAGDFNLEKGLAPASMQRTLAVFHEFAGYCSKHGVNRVKVVGTAAFRQAVNGTDFADQVANQTGLPIEIIGGDLEAQYTAKGVLSALDPVPSYSLIIDIGGGSTEYVLCRGNEVVWSASHPLGVVRLTENHGVPKDRIAEILRVTDTVVREVISNCKVCKVDPTQLSVVGTAGTITTLAALDMELTVYDWQKVNNYSMSADTLHNWYGALIPLSVTQREALPGMEKGRGDLIIAGLEIVVSLLDTLPGDSLTVSDFGILEGLLLSMENDT